VGKRSETINRELLDGLLLNHPYLLLFQKDDWKEYLELLALIYDYLEDSNSPVPIDVLKTILFRHYSTKIQTVDGKIANFFTMMIVELQVLKDSHDQWGKRFIETTPFGKNLLKLVESLISQRTRFSGTNAETMLGALNSLLLTGQEMCQEDAVKHHKEKIKAYEIDLVKIIQSGPKAAELLPLMHSTEALFGQAEEAAIHVLAATEDVKVAVERERRTLAERYIKQEKSAGENIRLLADFYLELHQTQEYKSYMQAKELFSQINFQSRFKHNDIGRLLNILKEKKVISDDVLRRSHLPTFSQLFEAADASIKEKIRVQIEILRQQVHNALMTDSHQIQSSLNAIFKSLYQNKDLAIECLEQIDLDLYLPWFPGFGEVELNSFHLPIEFEGMKLIEEKLSVEDMLSLGRDLIRAEENTIQEILEKFKALLTEKKSILISDYEDLKGFADFYVLTEADILDTSLQKELTGYCQLTLQFFDKDFIIHEVPNYLYTFKDIS